MANLVLIVSENVNKQRERIQDFDLAGGIGGPTP